MKVAIKVDVKKDIARLKAAAGKDAPKVMNEFMLKHGRALVSSNNKKFPGLIQVTPPFTKFPKSLSNSQARKVGETAVSAGVNRVYAGPGRLYARLWEKGERGVAIRFWKLVKAKKWNEASDLAKAHGEPGLENFDGGARHKKIKQGLSRGPIKVQKGQAMFIRERSRKKNQPPPSVKQYLDKKKKLVGLLAGCILAQARFKFGAINHVPAIADRHANNSSAAVDFSGKGEVWSFSVKNTMPYQMRDLKRLWSWAGEGRLMAMKADIKHAAKAWEKKLSRVLGSK